MADGQAEIGVTVTGADEAAQKLERIGKVGADAANKGSQAWANFSGQVGGAVRGAIQDITRIATVAQGISLAHAVEGAKKFQDTVARMSVFTGSSFDTLSKQYKQLAQAKLTPTDDIAGFHKQLAGLTYDTKGSIDAFSGLADEAYATGKSVDEMVPLGAMMHNVLGVTGDTTEALGRMRTQAESLGKVGGPAALHDMLLGTADVISQLSTKGPDALGKITALAAGFGGKNFTPEQSKRSFARVVGAIEQDPRGFLGPNFMKFYDEEGHLKAFEAISEVRKRAGQRGGTGSHLKALLGVTFGPEAAAAFMQTDLNNIAAHSNDRPSTEALDKFKQYAGSDAGKFRLDDITKEQAARESAVKYLPFLEKINHFLAANPVLGSVGLPILGNFLASSLGGLVSKGMATGVAGAAGASVMSLLSGLLPAAGVGLAGAAGYGAGKLIDHNGAASDWLSGMTNQKNADAAAFQKDELARQIRFHRQNEPEILAERQQRAQEKDAFIKNGMTPADAIAQANSLHPGLPPIQIQLDIRDKTDGSARAVARGKHLAAKQ